MIQTLCGKQRERGREIGFVLFFIHLDFFALSYIYESKYSYSRSLQ